MSALEQSPPDPNSPARNHHTTRRKLRKRLEAEGVPPDEVKAQVEALRALQGRSVIAQNPPGTKAAERKAGQSENARRRRALAQRDGEWCHWCGAELDITIRGTKRLSPPRATLDHILPKSMGGTSKLDNLVLACEPCNAARGGVHSAGAHPGLVGLPSKKGQRSLQGVPSPSAVQPPTDADQARPLWPDPAG